jgi:hypothetical protein
MGSIGKAIVFAAGVHGGAGHLTKVDGTPLTFHCVAVGRILAQTGCDDKIVTAGILHQVLCGDVIKPDEVTKEFGQEVVEWITSLVEKWSVNWYVCKLETRDKMSSWHLPSVLIKAADGIDFLRSISRLSRLSPNEDPWSAFGIEPRFRYWDYEGLNRSVATRLRLENERRTSPPHLVEALSQFHQEFSRLIHSLWPPVWQVRHNIDWEGLDLAARQKAREESGVQVPA